ncbi:unnamed protein product [Adineta ricciae]|uniref:Uncharacterized protein n=1 Tax=Adineta ricciae TaxID=249248 RepID=A0A813SWI8_ADIRI|nr:unnamed protein product [Adineta ricciae]CAF0801403.1 unnamed protein product [Adineta ricciae]
MTHSVIRRSPSTASSTVADPSTVTVCIESASRSDLNVQDVLTSSPSEDDDDEDEFKPKGRKQMLTDRFNYRSSSTASRQRTPALGNHHHNHRKNSFQHTLSGRLSTDSNARRASTGRPTTAGSLQSKSTVYENEWVIDSSETVVSPVLRTNPSYSTVTSTAANSKSSSSPKQQTVSSTFTPQQAPSVFTTTSEFLGTDFRSQLRRDKQRRSQSLVRQALVVSDPSSPTIPLVFLTDDVLLGSIRALQNERQLCKLSIDYIIDASNMRPDELARKANVGARLPCQCGHTHSRCTLTLEFDQPCVASSSSVTSADSKILSGGKIRELSRAHLGQLFDAVNRFILKSQQEDKRVLIYGFELTPNSPLAVIAIQYLMLINDQITLTEAIHTVHRLFPVIPKQHQQFPTMDKRFQDYLKQLERKTFSKNIIVYRISGDGNSSSSGNEHRYSLKDHSSGSPEITVNNETSITSCTTTPTPIINDYTNQTRQLFRTRSAWDS